MKKSETIEFKLTDTQTLVEAILLIDGDGLLDYIHEDARPVRVQAPLPQMDRILENGRYWVERDDRYGDIFGWLDFYIKCRENDIFKQIQEIRKSIKRIVRTRRAIQIVEEAKKEMKSKNGL